MTTASEAAAPTSGLSAARAAVDRALAGILDVELRGAPARVADPIRHAVLAPGKRIRPLLLVAAHRACAEERVPAEDEGSDAPDGGAWPGDPALALLGCSVELVHAYSLVHDDLPCMDDDVVRRGRPTVHIGFGVAPAILAGASLMPLAVTAIVEAGARLGLEPEVVSRLVRTLAQAAGGAGMVGGQLLDLQAEGRAVSREELERIHLGKTARLIEAACAMGARSGGATPELRDRLSRFGRTLGLAFQVVDDILDVTGSVGEMGKRGGRDAELGKATMASVLGVAEAGRLGRRLADDALALVAGLPRTGPLREIVHLVVERRR